MPDPNPDPLHDDHGRPPESRDEPTGIEGFFRPIVDDEALRPVVLAVLIGISSVIGTGILLAVRDRRPGAVIGITMLAIMSADGVVRVRRSNGRLGALGWSVIVVWLTSIGFAIGGEMSGYL